MFFNLDSIQNENFQSRIITSLHSITQMKFLIFLVILEQSIA